MEWNVEGQNYYKNFVVKTYCWEDMAVLAVSMCFTNWIAHECRKITAKALISVWFVLKFTDIRTREIHLKTTVFGGDARFSSFCSRVPLWLQQLFIPCELLCLHKISVVCPKYAHSHVQIVLAVQYVVGILCFSASSLKYFHSNSICFSYRSVTTVMIGV